MSDHPPSNLPPSPTDPSDEGIPTARPAGGHIPLSGAAGAAARGGKINEPSLLDLVDDTCPKCGKKLPHEAVVCTSCGYDLKDNIVHRADIPPASHAFSVDPDEDDATDAGSDDDFVQPGRGSAKVMAIAGGVLTLAAMVVAGLVAHQTHGYWFVTTKVAVVLYETLVHALTGGVAVYVVARVTERKLGSAELAVARMFAAFALFQLVRHIPIAVPYVGAILQLLAAMAIYFLTIWLLFARQRVETAMLAAAHFALWLLVTLGMILSQSLGEATAVSAAVP